MAKRTCTIDGCDGSRVGRGWCGKHYKRWQKHGDPHHVEQGGWPAAELRVWRWLTENAETGCWEWSGVLSADGYGRIRVDGKWLLIHRFMYERKVGPIPEGLQLDHLCRVRNCANPEHLEPVTCKENLARGDTFQARNAQKTHCPRGHEYDMVNSAGSRECRTCRRRTGRDHARRKRASESISAA